MTNVEPLPERISKEVRSRNMSRIRSRDTKPEKKVRGLLHAAGFRFRLHRRDLPGTPDIVLPKWRAVVDVRGCFWHDHGCHLSTRPDQNADFWNRKLTENAGRDARNAALLQELGWRHLIVWECALRANSALEDDKLGRDVARWIKSNARTGSLPT